MDSINDFESADNFISKIFEMSDPNAMTELINSTVQGIVDIKNMNSSLKVGIIQKIKNDLVYNFPFVAKLADETIQKIIGYSLYDSGKEVELGKILLESQNDKILCLDIILQSIRLLHRFSPQSFEQFAMPFITKHGLESYL